MVLVLPRRSLNIDFVRDGQASGDNYTSELSKLDGLLNFSRASTATRFNAAGVLETVAAGQPRFDFDPVTLACRGLLIEESRTNGLWPSSDFTSSQWSKTTTTVTANSAVAPDGTTSAALLTATAADSYVSQNYSASAGQVYTYSIWLKCPSGTRTIKIAIYNPGVGLIANYTCNVTTTWTRFSVSGTATGTVAVTIGTSSSFNAGDTVNAWGAQLELGAFATSYIPTTTSAVTRASEYAAITQLTPWLNQGGAGTITIDADFGNSLSAAPRSVMIWQNGTNFFELYNTTANGIAYFTVAGVTYTFPVNLPAPAGRIKQAVSWKTGAMSSVGTGGALSNAALAGFPSAITTVVLGGHISGFSLGTVWLARFAYQPFAVSDTLLKQMTA